MLFVHLLQCLVRLASVEECYSTQITIVFSGTTKYHNVHNEEDALRNIAYEISSCVESEQTSFVSRLLIPITLLNCTESHAVLYNRTSYLEGGRVICEAKNS